MVHLSKCLNRMGSLPDTIWRSYADPPANHYLTQPRCNGYLAWWYIAGDDGKCRVLNLIKLNRPAKGAMCVEVAEF